MNDGSPNINNTNMPNEHVALSVASTRGISAAHRKLVLLLPVYIYGKDPAMTECTMPTRRVWQGRANPSAQTFDDCGAFKPCDREEVRSEQRDLNTKSEMARLATGGEMDTILQQKS